MPKHQMRDLVDIAAPVSLRIRPVNSVSVEELVQTKVKQVLPTCIRRHFFSQASRRRLLDEKGVPLDGPSLSSTMPCFNPLMSGAHTPATTPNIHCQQQQQQQQRPRNPLATWFRWSNGRQALPDRQPLIVSEEEEVEEENGVEVGPEVREEMFSSNVIARRINAAAVAVVVRPDM